VIGILIVKESEVKRGLSNFVSNLKSVFVYTPETI
jgi:hypothetical protein